MKRSDYSEEDVRISLGDLEIWRFGAVRCDRSGPLWRRGTPGIAGVRQKIRPLWPPWKLLATEMRPPLRESEGQRERERERDRATRTGATARTLPGDTPARIDYIYASRDFNVGAQCNGMIWDASLSKVFKVRPNLQTSLNVWAGALRHCDIATLRHCDTSLRLLELLRCNGSWLRSPARGIGHPH